MKLFLRFACCGIHTTARHFYPKKPYFLPGKRFAAVRTQTLTEDDRLQRYFFAKNVLEKIKYDKTMLSNIIFSDEGYVNVKQNRMKDEMIPTTLSTIVWCGMNSKTVLGPYFFEESVNGKKYLEMINSFLLPQIQGYPKHSTWFQHDGFSPHLTKPVMQCLTKQFGNKLMSLQSRNIWPSKSQDLSPLDYFLWPYLKSCIENNGSISSLESLKEAIRRELRVIKRESLAEAVTEFHRRLRKCKNARGYHLTQARRRGNQRLNI